MRDGPESGLALIDALVEQGELADYHLLYSARAALLTRSGAAEEAAQSYERALALATHQSERKFLERQLASVRG